MASCNASRCLVAGAAVVLLMAAGCGNADRGYLTGTVLLSGQPVGPGTLSFEPLDGDRPGGSAFFGEDGKYTLMSAGRKEGAPIGEYRVLVYGGEGFGEETPGPRPKSKIPARYANPQTSDLKITIQPGKQTFDFDLKP
jgi:hypothetical protein